MKQRLSRDLELALIVTIQEAGEAQDQTVRSMALDAVEKAVLFGLPWLDKITITHLPDPTAVPTVVAEWD